MRHLAVLGSPIAHSLSPVLQNTAYRLLEVDYEYGLADVPSGGLLTFLDNLDDTWSGLSLTMPLKREVIPLLDEASPLVRELGVANTLVLSTRDGVRHLSGHNTDVDGIVRAIRRSDDARPEGQPDVRPERVAIIGGGATAASALSAAAELGATRVTLFLRDPAKAAPLVELARSIGVELDVRALDGLAAAEPLDFVISTLPGGVELPALRPSSSDAILLDVAYEPWPSPLARGWEEAGARAVSGLDMLVEQAIGQVRLFTGRAQDAALPDEGVVRAAMREAVGLPA